MLHHIPQALLGNSKQAKLYLFRQIVWQSSAPKRHSDPALAGDLVAFMLDGIPQTQIVQN
jgi:hypothetical protein